MEPTTACTIFSASSAPGDSVTTVHMTHTQHTFGFLLLERAACLLGLAALLAKCPSLRTTRVGVPTEPSLRGTDWPASALVSCPLPRSSAVSVAPGMEAQAASIVASSCASGTGKLKACASALAVSFARPAKTAAWAVAAVTGALPPPAGEPQLVRSWALEEPERRLRPAVPGVRTCMHGSVQCSQRLGVECKTKASQYGAHLWAFPTTK